MGTADPEDSPSKLRELLPQLPQPPHLPLPPELPSHSALLPITESLPTSSSSLTPPLPTKTAETEDSPNKLRELLPQLPQPPHSPLKPEPHSHSALLPITESLPTPFLLATPPLPTKTAETEDLPNKLREPLPQLPQLPHSPLPPELPSHSAPLPTTESLPTSSSSLTPPLPTKTADPEDSPNKLRELLPQLPQP